MTSVAYGFIHDGVFVGVQADTDAEALDFLAETYGDDVVTYVATAQAAIFDLVRAGGRGVAAGVPAGGVPGKPDRDEPEGEEEGTVFVHTQSETGGGDNSGARAEPVSQPTCAVCGAAITPDRYEMTVEDHGEGRCKHHDG